MRNNWVQVKLEDVCKEVTVGYVSSMAHAYVNAGIPFLRSQNILPYKVDLSDTKYIDNSFHEKLKKSALKKNDVVVVRTGYPGTAAVIPESLSRANCADLVIIRVSNALNPHYLSFIFNSVWGIKSVSGNLVGAAQQHFNVGAAKKLKISLPPIQDQEKIVHVLNGFNTLIDDNENRVRILETMAQKLFVEWFEKLKFPGYEKTMMVDSELGQIPEGWEVSKLNRISDIISGYPFKSSTYKKTGKYKIVTIKNVQTGEFVLSFDSFLEDLPANLPADCVLEQGDILLSLTGNVGRICTVLGEDHVLNQRVAKIKPKNNNAREYVYYMFSADKFRKKMEAFSNGAAQQNLSPVQLANFKIVIPGEDVLANFHNIVSNYFNLSLNLKEQNQALSKMRDLLIPQLITGRKELKN